jgi:hypothetical protein
MRVNSKRVQQLRPPLGRDVYTLARCSLGPVTGTSPGDAESSTYPRVTWPVGAADREATFCKTFAMPPVAITSDWTPPVDGRRCFPAGSLEISPTSRAPLRPVQGTEDLTRIHFETRDSMERGMATAAPAACCIGTNRGSSIASRPRSTEARFELDSRDLAL